MNQATFQAGFTIDVQQNIFIQFAEQLGCEIENNQITIENPQLKGQIQNLTFMEYNFKIELLSQMLNNEPFTNYR